MAASGSGNEEGMGREGASAREWTPREIELLTTMAQQKAPTKAIARALGRSPLAVRVKACRLGVSVAPKEIRRKASPAESPVAPSALAPVDFDDPRTLLLTNDFDVSGLTRGQRHILSLRLQEAAEREGEGLPRLRGKKGRPKKVRPKKVRGPLDDEGETVDLTAYPLSQRRGRVWRRFVSLQRFEEMEISAYEDAVRDIRGDLKHEIFGIVQDHCDRFIGDVIEAFALSLAEEVRARSREYQAFLKGNSIELAEELVAAKEDDALSALIEREEEKQRTWEASIHRRAVDAIVAALHWYQFDQPYVRHDQDAFERYREWLTVHGVADDRILIGKRVDAEGPKVIASA